MPNSFRLEEYDKLKNALFSLNPQKPLQAMMVTSALTGEGCTTVVANLALTLARNRTSRIVVVDANFRDPGLHKFFNLNPSMGLAELLQGEQDLKKVTYSVGLHNLFVVPVGRPHPNSPDILEDATIKPIINRLKADFEYVLFDTAPISLYPDSLMLAAYLDGVILVVQAGKTSGEIVRRVKEQLDQVQAHTLGVVLNRVKEVIPAFIAERL